MLAYLAAGVVRLLNPTTGSGAPPPAGGVRTVVTPRTSAIRHVRMVGVRFDIPRADVRMGFLVRLGGRAVRVRT